MYTATMTYHFKPEAFDTACAIWEQEVFVHAREQEGFVRMQLLVAPPAALAIGTWKSNADARRFMETGVFRALMQKLDAMIDKVPEQKVWDLRLYAEK